MSHLVSLAQVASLCCGDLLYNPVRRKVTVLDLQRMNHQPRYGHSTKVVVDAYENNRQWEHGQEGLIVWIKTETKTYNNAEEVWEVSCSSLAAGPSLEEVTETLAQTRWQDYEHIRTQVFSVILPSMHHGTPELPDDRCSHLWKENPALINLEVKICGNIGNTVSTPALYNMQTWLLTLSKIFWLYF